MTRCTPPAPGVAGMDAGVRAVVAGGEVVGAAIGGDVPLHHAVVLVWLEHTVIRRNQAAAAA